MNDVANTTVPQAAGTTVTVDDLYHALLGRSADADGSAFFAAQVQAGTSMQDIASQIIASQEFQQGHGVQANEQFVGSIYQNYLHIAGDDAGVAFWAATVAAEGNALATVDFISGVHALSAYAPALIGQLATNATGF